MNKNCIFPLLFLSFLATSQQAYYNGINFNLNGLPLKNQLAQLITLTQSNELSYTPGVWNALRIVDRDPANPNDVLLVYGWENGTDSDVTNDRSRDRNNNGADNGQWNREHIYAQSVGTPDLGQSGPGSDAHMLRACDVQRNASRANRKFAIGSGNSGVVTNGNWYPGDEWKGDVARIIMYMYVRYGDQCLPNNMGVGANAGAGDSMIDLFLTWNTEDPVSSVEVNRNNYLGNANNTYGQGNRNPFIDNPYLATKIWGGTPAQDIWGILSTPSFATFEAAIFPNPAVDGTFSITTATPLTDIIITHINGQTISHILNPTANGIVYTISQIPSGFYLVTLVSSDTSLTKKVIIK